MNLIINTILQRYYNNEIKTCNRNGQDGGVGLFYSTTEIA
jgi:hypothetical protein